MLDKTLWEQFLETVEPHLPEYLHWNEICVSKVYLQTVKLCFITARKQGHFMIVHFLPVKLICYRITKQFYRNDYVFLVLLFPVDVCLLSS